MELFFLSKSNCKNRDKVVFNRFNIDKAWPEKQFLFLLNMLKIILPKVE